MSKRHRAARNSAPGATHAAPTKEERRASNRRARHRTHELLARVDEELADDVVTPRPRHETVDLDPSELETNGAKPARARETRHWKQKFWKRRTNERARKAALASQLD